MTKQRFGKLKIVLSCLLCLALTLGCVFGAQKLLMRKTSERTYGTFKRIGKDVDVLFLGSSHVWYGIFPMEIWKDHGIAGYTIGYSAYRLPMDYWALEEAYRYCTPKVLLLDVYIMSEIALSNNDASLHTLFDAFPSDLLKYRALKELDHTLEGPTDTFDLMFPLSGYHTRWNDLKQEDLEPYNNVKRGANRTYRIAWYEDTPERIDRSIVTDDYNNAMEYIERIIRLAQNHGTEVLLTLLPQPCLPEAQKYYNWCFTLEEKYGLSYVDLTDLDLVDYHTDCYDILTPEERLQGSIDRGTFVEGSLYDYSAHLNVSGARKVTKWLGQYLADNYDLPDHRGEARYAYWDEDYETWYADCAEELRGLDNLSLYLMALAGGRYDVTVEACDPALWTQHFYARLADNCGLTADLRAAMPAGSGEIVFRVCREGTGELLDRVSFGFSGSGADIVFGAAVREQGGK